MNGPPSPEFRLANGEPKSPKEEEEKNEQSLFGSSVPKKTTVQEGSDKKER